MQCRGMGCVMAKWRLRNGGSGEGGLLWLGSRYTDDGVLCINIQTGLAECICSREGSMRRVV